MLSLGSSRSTIELHPHRRLDKPQNSVSLNISLTGWGSATIVAHLIGSATQNNGLTGGTPLLSMLYDAWFPAKKNRTEQRLLELLGSPRYQPLNKTELAKELQIPLNERSKFRRLLNDLETGGKITRIRKDRFVLPQEADLMVGVLQVNPDGFGYLLNESGDGLGDLYISAENQGTAMHKDRVVARISRDRVLPERSGRRRANREGRVIKILVRANQTIVGTLQRSKNFYYVVPDEPALVHDIYVTVQAGQLPRTPEVNDKVVVRMDVWEHRHLNPEGSIIEVLGPAQQPGVAILSIIRKHDLPVAFPDAVLREADEIPLNIPERELHAREDLRNFPIFTIDPDNARDFDDAVHVTDSEGGDGAWGSISRMYRIT